MNYTMMHDMSTKKGEKMSQAKLKWKGFMDITSLKGRKGLDGQKGEKGIHIEQSR